MAVHTAGPDDRCVVCGEVWPCPTSSASYDLVQPRRLDPNPRCGVCKSGGMFHPLHRWWVCDIRLPSGDLCGCTVTDQPLRL